MPQRGSHEKTSAECLQLLKGKAKVSEIRTPEWSPLNKLSEAVA